MTVGRITLLFPIPSIFIHLFFFTFAHSSPCLPSSCGDLTEIRYPFRLKTDPPHCGHFNTTYFRLDCRNNRTVMTVNSKGYFVQDINYEESRVRLADPGINRTNLSSCPLYSNSNEDWPLPVFIPHLVMPWEGFIKLSYVSAVFVHCLSPVYSVKYVKAPFCGNRSNHAFGNPLKFYSYILVGKEPGVLDLKESCMVDKVDWWPLAMMRNNSSLEDIYNGLAYGFELVMLGPYYGRRYFSQLRFVFVMGALGLGLFIIIAFGMRCIAGCLFGFPFLTWLVVYNWRRRHLSMDKGIEEFLQKHHNLAPIKYTYSQIKKMTCNFHQKLGEGGCGTVYKGKLGSGISIAVKMMEQSTANEKDFINEVESIVQIHHTNIVRLIGFCVEHSRCALVYEFLPNGSLDRYIFDQHSLDAIVLTYDKILEIALGVARGINYLHHGCSMQILHFDIKPHNILLDENFHPKISDFGLARLHPRDESYINLTTARGTIGYMAPEMFYKNFGGISYKVDVYSFGMMLMEMVSGRKNMYPYGEGEDTSEIYFPLWAYEQLCAGENIEMYEATEEEKKMVKKIVIVGLWCMQMRQSDRPAMNKIIEMLESELEPQMPPKPFFAPY